MARAAPTSPLQRIALDALLLDPNNPRFGLPNQKDDQVAILDRIVNDFGIDDVASSLAVNGYFDAEPLVCKAHPTKKGKFIVVEGNRRLAACLVISNDERAHHQKSRAEDYQDLWEKHKKPSIDPTPCIVFDASTKDSEIQSYLGVRHIASAQPWDSYAKAAWVANVVKNTGMSIDEISLMIGDQHKTISRLLQGFYFVRQLEEEGVFRPGDSLRRGRGSVTEYPFSWVYTILGYKSLRDFLELGQASATSNPVKKTNLKKGGLVLNAMFGDKSRGRNAAIDDSREIGALADALADPIKVALLEKGRTIKEIDRETKPISDRLTEGLLAARDILMDIVAGMSENALEKDVAEKVQPLSGRTRSLAVDVDKRVREVILGDDN